MAFEFRDKTEDYVQFIKDGEGIHYKGTSSYQVNEYSFLRKIITHCVFQIDNTKKNQISGDRNLAEYEILVEDLNITTSQNNHSLALVKVVFRRQGGFHLLTSFVSSKNIRIHQLSTDNHQIKNPFHVLIVKNRLSLISGTIVSDHFRCIYDVLFPRA